MDNEKLHELLEGLWNMTNLALGEALRKWGGDHFRQTFQDMLDKIEELQDLVPDSPYRDATTPYEG
jgi:hypothetical protein